MRMILGNGIRAGSSLTALFLVALAAFAQVASDATQQGNKLLEESKPAEAVALFQRALSENPRDADALRGMGKAQEWLGHFPEAVASYRQAVAVEPNDAGTWFALGRVQSWQGERETAYESFEKALLLNPNNLEIELAYAEVLSWNPSRRQESLSRYQRILQQWPESVSAQLGLAQAQAWSGLTSQAEQTYDTVLRQESNNPQALLGKSQIARWEMRLFTAHDLLLQAIRAAPSNPQVLRALAETEIDLGQYDLARERANQLAGLAPDDSQQVEEQIRQAQRPFFETGYQLRRDRKSPIQTRLSWDAFQSVLSVPVTSRMRWRFAFRPTLFRGEDRLFSANEYGTGVEARLGSRVFSSLELRADTYPGAPSNAGGNFLLRYAASDSLRVNAGVERGIVSDSLHSAIGSASNGIFMGQVRSNLASLNASFSDFPRQMDFYAGFSGGFYGGRSLNRNQRLGFDAGFGKTLRSYRPYIRAGYGFTYFGFAEDQSFLPGPGAPPGRAGGYFSPRRFFNNFAALSLSHQFAKGGDWGVEGSLGVQQAEDRFTSLDQPQLSSSFRVHFSLLLEDRFSLALSYDFLNVGGAYQRNLFSVSLRTYF